nr:reverse transcriptase domain-containing protein [Tanacetum cinerariifolium]
MADRTIEEILQAPTEGYGEAIVIPKILAENFEIKTNLLQLVQANNFHGRKNDYPHTHISNFKRMTATLKYRDVPNDAIKLMLFLYSLEDRARICEAWDCFKEFLRACPHHGFSELTQIDTFYNGLTEQDQDSLNAASGGNLLNKTTREALQIIENKSKGEMKALTTRSGLAYEGPSIPTESLLEKVDEKNTEEILDKEHSDSSGSTAQVQPSVVPISISKPDVLRTRSKPSISYPSRLNDQKLREKATNQMEKFFQIFHDWHFDISFLDALLLMPKFASTIKSLLANKDKLFELAKVSLNENCLAMLLKKHLEKLGDLGKFLIPCDFPRMNVCHALADLGASINLMPLSIWKKLSLPELTPTRMTLELADSRSKSTSNFREVLLENRVNDESVTFNLDQLMKYSDNSVKRVNVINIASEEVVHDNTKSSNPTLVSESDFYDSIQIENCVVDPEGDILLIEKLLNEDPCQLSPMNLNQEKYPIEEPEYSFSMGYKHFITTPVTELDKVAKSNDKNLVPIPHEYEVTSDNESEYNDPINDDSFSAFVYSNLLFDDDEIYSDELESHVESNLVESLSNHDTLKFDHLDEFSGALMPIHIAEEERIRKEHAEYISLIERLITINPCPRPTVNANTIVESLPSSLILFQDNDSQREEIDIVIDTDELLPLGFENDDSEGEIFVLEGLRVDNSISNSKNELSGNEASDFDNPSFLRPPPEPPDAEFDFEPNTGEKILVVMNDNDELECLDLGEEFDISTNEKDDNCFFFIFVIRISLPYLIYPKVFSFLLSAESEDTIFDPGISV